jgi:hypothetical protein
MGSDDSKQHSGCREASGLRYDSGCVVSVWQERYRGQSAWSKAFETRTALGLKLRKHSRPFDTASAALGALEPRDAGAPGLPEADAQGEPRGADRIEPERCDAAQRSGHQRPPRLAALEELDQIALFTW